MSCRDKEGVECDGLHQYGNTIAVCVYCMYLCFAVRLSPVENGSRAVVT